MERKVTKEQFIEAIENNEEGLYDFQLAAKLGITPEWFSHLKTEYMDKICDYTTIMAKKTAVDQINNLKRNARIKFDTKASLALLEKAGEYTPASKQTIDGDIKVGNGVIILPAKKPVGASVEIDKKGNVISEIDYSGLEKEENKE